MMACRAPTLGSSWRCQWPSEISAPAIRTVAPSARPRNTASVMVSAPPVPGSSSRSATKTRAATAMLAMSSVRAYSGGIPSSVLLHVDFKLVRKLVVRNDGAHAGHARRDEKTKERPRARRRAPSTRTRSRCRAECRRAACCPRTAASPARSATETGSPSRTPQMPPTSVNRRTLLWGMARSSSAWCTGCGVRVSMSLRLDAALHQLLELVHEVVLALIDCRSITPPLPSFR